MSALADLVYLGAPVAAPIETAGFIGKLVLSPRQKAALLRAYLAEKREPLSVEIRRAAAPYEEFL